MTHYKLRHHLPDTQPHAVDNMQSWHDDALYALGEYSMFVLLWRISDHKAGLVDRCPVCYDAYQPYADVYKQPFEHHCSSCFGTTFEGGYKAKIVRPSLWDFGEEADGESRRGELTTATTAIQTTSDFRMRTGDWVIRADATRWQVATLSANHLRTGFSYPEKEQSVVGFNYGNVIREDESANAYLVPPTDPAEVAAILDVRGARTPQDFAIYEDIRVPLTPNPLPPLGSPLPPPPVDDPDDPPPGGP